MKWYWWAIGLTWELPQTILASFVHLTSHRGEFPESFEEPDSQRVKPITNHYGVSLGRFIFMYDLGLGWSTAILHEMGHSKQSLMLGPLYLIVVGLPSIVMNVLTRASVLDPYRYYRRWPENWADRLGGVRR